jgi:hypothetical protein
MENALEQEQEMIFNRLQKEMDQLRRSGTSSVFNGDSQFELSSDEFSSIISTENLLDCSELKKQYENKKSLVSQLYTEIEELNRKIDLLRTENLSLRIENPTLVSKNHNSFHK